MTAKISAILRCTVFLPLITLLFPAFVKAQFNDSISNYLHAGITGNVNRTSDGYSTLSSNILEFKRRTKKIAANTSLRFIYGEQNDKITNNDFFALQQLNIYRRDQRFYAWFLASYEHVFSLGVNHQFQAGPGLAYYLVNKTNLTFNVSNGILYEYRELLSEELDHLRHQTLRNSLRLQFKISANEFASLSSTFFLQNSLADVKDVIIREETELQVRIYKKINVAVKAVYSKLTSTGKETLLITWGLTFKNYF